MVKDKDISDEIIQEVFIKVWDSRHKIDEDKSFESYLYIIAENKVYNYFRKLASDNRLIQSLLAQTNVNSLNGEELLENKEVSELIRKAIDELSPQRKMAFTLCKIEGKSYKEASEMMRVSVATINSHITRSLQIIKTYVLNHQELLFAFIIAEFF